jgi:hypothetical protein
MLICVVVIGANVYGLYLEYLIRQMIGSATMAISGAVIGSLSMIVFTALLLWLAVVMRLHLRVSNDELLIELAPIVRRVYHADDLAGWDIVTAGENDNRGKRPVRFAIGWASGIVGGEGVRLRLSDGRTLSVDVHQREEFVNALEALRRHAARN